MTGRVSGTTVLHVIESYGAGTASAAAQYVRATPDLTHHLVRRFRPDDDHADDGESELFASVAEIAPGVGRAVRSVRRRVLELRPDVVHAHSSFGGAFTRLAVSRRGRRIVYTPHCFSMERADLGAGARRGYGLAERLLGLNTDVFAGCSEREVELARLLARRRQHVWVPNLSDVTAADVAHLDVPAYDLVAAGRLTAQRDPEWFRDVVERVREQRGPVSAAWVGGGDPDQVDRLRGADITVTGWLPRSAALATMARSAVYVHTAVWDGAPMTVLEAQRLGRPIAARSSPALATAPRPYVGGTVTKLAGVVLEALASPAGARANADAWAGHFAGHTVERQRAALLEAYGQAS
ncbi:MAG: glycosyltransferase [Nocardioides sp.]|nr:glycosyltransferase [Nocardioides sp.]